MIPLDDLSTWKTYVLEHWQTLHRQAASQSGSDSAQRLVATLFQPLLPAHPDETRRLVQFLERTGIARSLATHLRERLKTKPDAPLTLPELVDQVQAELTAEHHARLYHQLFSEGALAGMTSEARFNLVVSFLQDTPAATDTQTRLSLRVETITGEQDVIIAGRDVYTQGTHPHVALTGYLSELRGQWDFLDFSNIVPDPIRHIQTRLHQLYTSVDVWNISPLDTNRADELARFRQHAVEQDLTMFRVSIVNALNDAAHLVITGGPGTGKSTVCGYLATGLAYACDPAAEQQDGLRGLALLGEEWQHGARLPVYVRLRQFASDAAHFPAKLKDASHTHLLGYLKHLLPDFAAQLTTYFGNPARGSDAHAHDGIQGAILILDGLDEIYNPADRRKAKKVIEHFAETYPHCRMVVTCRSATYRHNVPWRLSDRFAVAELAPYTWDQVSEYVRNWYRSAAENRPASLGGAEVAPAHAGKYAASLIQTLRSNTSLWSLARQPLLLTLIVLIHEEDRHLPQNRAELYEKTVNLLHKWNPPDEDDPLATRLQTLNYQRVREVLQLTAFNAQRDRVHYKDNDASIKRPELIAWLLSEDSVGSDKLLGAAIDDVLEYLATRNGIIVADSKDSYRFLHLSIREYLAACALIEQYNEIIMPADLVPVGDAWKFPENIAALLSKDPYRWREVALFCGAILGNDRGQDRLWTYLETLLPDVPPMPGASTAAGHRSPYDEGDLYRIAIAAEVWSANQMRTRLRSHHMIRQHLRQTLQAILMDDRLDVPEHTQITELLRQLDSSDLSLRANPAG